MARRRRRARVVRPPEPTQEVVEVKDKQDDERVSTKPVTGKRRKRAVVASDSTTSESAQSTKQRKKSRSKPKSKPKSKPVHTEVEAVPEPCVVDAEVCGADLLHGLLDILRRGVALVITVIGTDCYSVAVGDSSSEPSVQKLSGKAYWDEVLSDEYKVFLAEWRELTVAERVKMAKKASIQWDQDDDPRINNMRLTAAYWNGIGIQKYKDEYMTRSARRDIRAK